MSIAPDTQTLPTAINPIQVPEGYKWTEAGVIPDDWGVSDVGTEFRIQLGKMLDTAKNVGEAKLYIGNRAVQWGNIILDDLATVKMTPSDLQRFRLRKGDLLVCEGGEIGRAAIWNDPISECYYQKALHRLRPTRGYNVFVLMCLLQLYTSNGYLTNFVTQTSIAHLPKDKFEQVPLPVPPPDEQHAIAAALSDVDGLIAALEALIVKKRDIKQATMQQLLTGRTRLPGFSGEWEEKRLGEVVSIQKGQLITESSVIPGSIPVVAGGKQPAYFHNVPNRTGKTITVSASGANAGYVALYKVPIFASDCSTISERSHYCLEFIYYQLLLRQGLIYNAQTGGAQPHIHAVNLTPLEILISSLKEQHAIAAVLSDMDAEIAALERRLDKTKQIKQGMMQQLLTGRIRLLQPEQAEATP